MTTTPPQPSDDKEIQNLFQHMLDAWTNGDAKAYVEYFTEDADYVSFDGNRAIGRQASADEHDLLFRGVLRGSALVGDIQSIRYITPDVAIVHATGSVLMPWRSKLPKKRQSLQTIIALRTNEGWRFTAFHNTRVRPVTIPAPDSFPSKMSHLIVGLARAFKGKS